MIYIDISIEIIFEKILEKRKMQIVKNYRGY